MSIYVGTSGYSYPKWKGPFYPKTLPNTQMLRYYGEHFPTVEINSTFNAMPKASVLQKWMADVPAGFQFVLKAPKLITHIHRLKDSGELVAAFHKVAETLAKHRGPLLFQLPPTAKKDLSRLRTFLQALPAQHKATFEFRHPTWFDDEVFGLLHDHAAALCIADADDELQIPFVGTTDWGYLRLRRDLYDDAELTTWANRVKKQDWRDAFVYFKHDDEGNGPRMALRFKELVA